MTCNVPVAEAITDEGVFPERVREALGQLVGAAKEGLLALSVEVGLGVLRELLEAEVEELVGPKGKWNRDRTAVRHGHEDGEVTLGGRRVQVRRPRARTADGESEVPLVSYEHFADRDQLADMRLAVIMLDGIELHGRTTIVALGISTEGDKLALGLWDGSTEKRDRRRRAAGRPRRPRARRRARAPLRD